MRIARLTLERYGHLTGETLAFPAEAGLHVVLGANEAGKSTALEALADGLFGFEQRTTRDYLHPADTLRIGLTLRAADGREASFVRRKGRRDTLLDGAGAAVPDSALSPFLGGSSRKRFVQMFGLDAAGLRAGGAAILTEQGEAGAAILQARTGLRGLREAVKRLDEEARTLHGDGRGVRRISAAATAIAENRRKVAERSLSGPGHRTVLDQLAAAEAALAAIGAEAAALRAEQARLERIRRTAPVRGVLAQVQRDLADDLATLGPVPALPDDAAAQRAAALAARELTVRDLARDRGRAGTLDAALAALPDDTAVLAEAEAIGRLMADRSRIAGIAADRLVQSGVADQRQRDLDATGARLGLPERGAALRDRIPDAVTRSGATRLLAEYTGLAGARAQAEAALTDAATAMAAAGQALAGHTPPSPAGALRDAAAAAQQEGRLDEALAEATEAHAAAAAALADALAALPLWTGSADRLAEAAVPPEAELQRLAEALGGAEAARAAAAQALAAHDGVLAATQAALRGVAAAGALPTADAVHAARDARDDAWTLLRRWHEAGEAPDAPALAGVGAAELADRVERLLREADALADRRWSEARRVADWERLTETEARDRALREGLAAALHTGQTALDAAIAAWRAAWQPAGVPPGTPAAMRDWLRHRAAVLEGRAEAAQAERRCERVAQRHGRVLGALQAALPDVTGAEAVLPLQEAARRQLDWLDAAAAAHAKAQAAAEAAAARLAEAERAVARIGARLTVWHGAWQDTAPRLGLPAMASADDAATALRLWAEIEAQAAAWQQAADRVQEMEAALLAHDQALAALADRLGLAVSDRLVAELAARLTLAQAARTERRRLLAERAELEAGLARQSAILDRAEAGLASLRALAGAADDAGLAAAIARLAWRAALADTARQRQAELHALDDGKGAAELAQEAAAIDIDAVPGRLLAIGARLTELDTARTAQAGLVADGRTRLLAMEQGQDVAGPAQAIRDSLVEIEDAAARYVRLRLAHRLLHAGIEQYRRAQQGPLLQAAGGLFAGLTAGRYARLELDETDKGEPVIIAVRPDGSHCKADHLSEGTRDQLFLALRLAAIAGEAAAGETLPLIADDLLVNFDDRRARAALRLLAEFGRTTQVILFTHHGHVAAMADAAGASLHCLPRELAAA